MGEGWVGQGTVITCQARWAEKAGETRVIFIVRGWWGDKQPLRPVDGETRYISGTTTIPSILLRSSFSLLRICGQAAGSDRYGKHETERRGVSGSKRKPLNGISAEQKTEKAGREKGNREAVDIPISDAFNFNWSIKANEILAMAYWQLFIQRAERTVYSRKLICYST